jgi:DUF4097 and DUF4098 domain-containing protein YvlB
MTTRSLFLSLAPALLLGIVAAPGVRAQSTFDSTVAVRGGTRLSVENPSGHISIRSWNRSQVRIQAELESDRARVSVRDESGRLHVGPAGRHPRGEVEYTITVPGGMAVDVNGMSADVEVIRACGEVQVAVMSGDVTVDCARGSVRVQTMAGDVTVSDAEGDVEVATTSGDVDIRGARGRVAARNTSGDVQLEQVDATDVTAETVSGTISFIGPLRDNGRYRLEAHSGEVTVRVQGTLNATVEVSTFSGEFESDFPVQLEPGSRVSARDWSFRVGTGGARLRMQSFSGTVSLRRAAGRTTNREE